jgi:antitoxin PrlF
MRPHDLESSVSPKGQVTIPAEIRRLLGVRPKDRVRFEVEDGRVRLRPVRSALDELYMSLPGLKTPRTWEELEEIAHEDRAERLAKEGQG